MNENNKFKIFEELHLKSFGKFVSNTYNKTCTQQTYILDINEIISLYLSYISSFQEDFNCLEKYEKQQIIFEDCSAIATQVLQTNNNKQLWFYIISLNTNYLPRNYISETCPDGIFNDSLFYATCKDLAILLMTNYMKYNIETKYMQYFEDWTKHRESLQLQLTE